jgi:PAS domain S-box-containing protein
LSESEVYRRLRETAGRIARDEPVEPADLLRLADELDRYEVEIEVQNEELRRVSRDLEASRREFYDLFESAPVAYLRLSPRGDVEKANRLARRSLGLAPSVLQGLPFATFVTCEHREVYFQRLARVREGDRSTAWEMRLRGVMGEAFEVHVQLAPRLDAEGGLDGLQLAFFDIRDRKRIDTELRERRAELMLATEAGGSASGGMT